MICSNCFASEDNHRPDCKYKQFGNKENYDLALADYYEYEISSTNELYTAIMQLDIIADDAEWITQEIMEFAFDKYLESQK